MNKMKLLICAIFSLILTMGLTACGGEEEDTTTQEIEPVPEEGVMGEEGTTEMEEPTETEGTTEMGEPTPPEGTTEGATVEERVEEEKGQP